MKQVWCGEEGENPLVKVLDPSDGVGLLNLISDLLLSGKDAQYEHELQRGGKGARDEVQAQKDWAELRPEVADRTAQNGEAADSHQRPATSIYCCCFTLNTEHFYPVGIEMISLSIQESPDQRGTQWHLWILAVPGQGNCKQA